MNATGREKIVYELQYKELLHRFLQEDLGVEGDVTTKYLNLGNREGAASIVAREPGTAAGLIFVEPLFKLLHPECRVKSRVEEGSDFESGDSLLLLTGPARALLSGERTALNLLSRTFGIATGVRQLVNTLEGLPTRLLPTRKTLPGFRLFDKYAAELGGAARHRYGLNDAVMLKDNHLTMGASLDEVLRSVRYSAGHMLTLEFECDRLEQLVEVLRADSDLMEAEPRTRGVDAILLDNMSLEDLRQAVELIRCHPRLILSEASGGITPENLREVAETGVDYVSLGAITHTVKPVDLGLDFLEP